jgi:maleamate amidohydrolase
VIDMTYKFLGDRPEPIEQAVRTRRTACGNLGWKTVPAFRRVLDAARSKSVPVIYTTGVEIEERPAVENFGARPLKTSNAIETPRKNLRRSYQIIEELTPKPADIVLQKQKPSAFFGTPLISTLIALKVDSLYITGCATGGCVRATAVDAFNHNYHSTVIADCCFDRFEASHAMALFDLGCKYAEIAESATVLPRISAMSNGLFGSA